MLLNLSLSLLNCTSIQKCTKGKPQTGSINSGKIKKKKSIPSLIITFYANYRAKYEKGEEKQWKEHLLFIGML